MTTKTVTSLLQEVMDERDLAIKMLARWCVAIDVNGTGWDDWDEHYKNAMWRKTDLPKVRELLDEAILKAREERGGW